MKADLEGLKLFLQVEKRAGDRFFATGMGGRMNAQYAGRRLRMIDGGSARQRQALFG